MKSFIPYLATVWLLLQLTSAKWCPPTVLRKFVRDSSRNVYEVNVLYPACEGAYSVFTSVYITTEIPSSISSSNSESATSISFSSMSEPVPTTCTTGTATGRSNGTSTPTFSVNGTSTPTLSINGTFVPTISMNGTSNPTLSTNGTSVPTLITNSTSTPTPPTNETSVPSLTANSTSTPSPSISNPSSSPPPTQLPFIIGGGFEAWFGGFQSGNPGAPVTYCPPPPEPCPGPFFGETVLTNCTDKCYMAVSVPNGQQVFVSPTGALAFTNPGSNGSDVPAGSYTTGFRHFPGSPGYMNFTGVANKSTGFLFCLNFIGSRAAIYADVPGFSCGGCSCFPWNVTTTDFTEGEYAAYAYNGSSQVCLGGVC